MTCEMTRNPDGSVTFACSRGRRSGPAAPHTHMHWQPTLDPALEQCLGCGLICRHQWVRIGTIEGRMKQCTRCQTCRKVPEGEALPPASLAPAGTQEAQP